MLSNFERIDSSDPTNPNGPYTNLQNNLNEILLHLSKPTSTNPPNLDELRKHSIIFEYKLIETYGAQIEWDGVICVRNGLFKGARFRIRIVFPTDFPRSPPSIFFDPKAKIVHPQIDPTTGEFDVKNQWIYGKTNLVYTLINDLKSVFLDVSSYFVSDSLNPSAAALFMSDPMAFKKFAKESVEASLVSLSSKEFSPEFSLSEYGKPEEELRSQLANISSDSKLTFEEKKKKLMEAYKLC